MRRQELLTPPLYQLNHSSFQAEGKRNGKLVDGEIKKVKSYR
jgi:hypothetical protein